MALEKARHPGHMLVFTVLALGLTILAGNTVQGWIVGTLTLKWALETWADWRAYG